MVQGFYLYDIAFLVVFTLAVVIFLYTRRSNLKREGLLYLYRTKVGIRFIEWTSKKFPKTLYVSQYFVLFSGYALMIGMIYMLFKFSYFYLTSPIAAEALKVPVVVPLIPYLPEIFNLDFLPPFYFTYWIIIIAIIAIPHEFAHGIFARLNKIKIHSTGFGFLGPFLAAFVEPDEKTMAKANKFSQLSILASGTFANIIFAVLFALIFWGFFAAAFEPAGVTFNSYASDVALITGISAVNGIQVSNVNEIPELINESATYTEIKLRRDNSSYFAYSTSLKLAVENNAERIPIILDSPAFRAELIGAINAIDGVEVKSFEQLRNIIGKYKAGDQITITTIQKNGEEKDYEINVAELNGRPFLGIAVLPPRSDGLLGWAYGLIAKIKDPFIYYQSSLGDFGFFIYHLLWWIILVNISVALVNMLPLGIFDGGRFFLITIWGLTGNQKFAERAFKFSTYLILLLIVALMVRWVFIFV